MQSRMNPTIEKFTWTFPCPRTQSSQDFSVRASKITRLFFLVKSQNYSSIKDTQKANDHCGKLIFVNTRGKKHSRGSFQHRSVVRDVSSISPHPSYKEECSSLRPWEWEVLEC